MVNDTLVSGGIHFTGLGSGTDFDEMISKLVDVESNKKTRLELWKKSWEDKITAFQELNSAMLDLSTTLKGMNSPSTFVVKTSESSNESAISAVADASAQPATHSVSVTQLAQNNVIYSNATVADPANGDLTGGAAKVFSYTYNGQTVNLNVASGTTLQGLANVINNTSGNPGVRAEVLKIADGDYRLKLVGMDLGANYGITINAATTLAGYGSGTYATAQTNQNAKFSVDGIALERASNTVDDAVTGLTINLKASLSTATITVATDTEAVKENIRKFVDQVNTVRTLISEMTKFNESENKGSILTGNYGVQLISQNLKDAVAEKAVGFDYDEDIYTSLSQIGITTNADTGSVNRGLLVIDEEKLDEALTTNFQAVADLFAADHEGSTDSPDFSYSNLIKGTTQPGSYKVAYTVGAGPSVTGTIGGYAASYDSATGELTATEGPAKGLSIKITNMTAGSYSGSVRVKLGKAGQLASELDDLTDSTDGPLHILEDNYDTIIDNIDKKIETEERRLKSFESDLRMRFARLEALLEQYQGVQTSLNNAITQLQGSSSS